jgi:hypothetical protein
MLGVFSLIDPLLTLTVDIGADALSVVTSFVVVNIEFITPGSALVTDEQMSANACNSTEFISEAEVVVDVEFVVNVKHKHVLIFGIGETGAKTAAGCGFNITPNAFLSSKKSGNQSRTAFLSAALG